MTPITNILSWIAADWRSRPVRLVLEVVAWAMSIGCALTMALTVPNPPFLILYPLFITQCMIFLYTAWTRGSLGMVANYSLLITIDVCAYIKMVIT